MRDHRRRLERNGHWIKERYKLPSMIQEGKWEYWEAFCTEFGEKSLLEFVRWAKDPWRLKETMGRLRGSDGRCLESGEDKVGGWCRTCLVQAW